jgi:uroporphyrinogen-III synthase
MSSDKPLAGKTIVVTRAAAQARELCKALIARGAQVMLLPLVEFAPVWGSTDLDEALSRLESFDAIVFLSANAVRYVFEHCRELGVAFNSEHRPKLVAAIGPATARAVEEQGLHAEYVVRESTSAGVAREMRESLAGKSVLLPRSDRGNESAPAALTEIGARVTEVVAYRAAMPQSIDAFIAARLGSGEADAMVFASPSAVQNFVAIFGADEAVRIAQHVRFAAIGPTTAQALRDANLLVAMEAAESSTQGLVDALTAGLHSS